MRKLYSRTSKLIQPGFWLMDNGFIAHVRRRNSREYESDKLPFEYSNDGRHYTILSENVAKLSFLGMLADWNQSDELRANLAQRQPSCKSRYPPMLLEACIILNQDNSLYQFSYSDE